MCIGASPPSRLVFLGGVEEDLAVVLDGERDEVRAAADRAVLRENLASTPARVHEDLVVLAAERATIRHAPHSTRYHAGQEGLAIMEYTIHLNNAMRGSGRGAAPVANHLMNVVGGSGGGAAPLPPRT